MGKFLSLDEVKKHLDTDRAHGPIVFTNGCFDLLHVGHVRYLQNAKALGYKLVVAVNSDASVSRLKGPKRPVQNENDRAEILAALGCVDYTFIFVEDTPLKVIHEISPNILVKGGDWAVKDIVGSEFVLAQGGKVLSLPFVEGRSTTQIISKANS
ncbi:MAG: D-glycero-beta-D-manno-heptose 1-phosphate adenylyltransferase [Bdellovibrionales bacterium]